MNWKNSISKYYGILFLCLPLVYTLSGCLTDKGPGTLQRATGIQAQQPETAHELYTTVIQENPGTALETEARYRKGILFLKTGQVDTAREHLVEAVKQNQFQPWSSAAQVQLVALDFRSIENAGALLDTHRYILQTTTPFLRELHRKTHLIGAEIAGYQQNWIELLSLLDAYGEPESGSIEGCRWLILNAQAHAHLNQPQTAYDNYQQAMLNGCQDEVDLVKAMLQLQADETSRLNAIDLALDRPDLFSDPDLITAFQTALMKNVDEGTLQTMIQEHRQGFSALLLRFEHVRRQVERAEVEAAKTYLEMLYNNWPHHRKAISRQILELEQLIAVAKEKIGIMVPMSGPLTAMGHSIFRGAQLAISDYESASGQIEFELIVRDVATSSAIDILQDLDVNEKVIAVVGPVRSKTTEEAVEICHNREIPLLTPGCPTDGVVDRSPWAFRLYPQPDREMEHLIQYSINDLEITRFGCFYPDIDYGRSATRNLAEIIHSQQGELLYNDSYARELTAIRQLVSTRLQQSVDAIIIPDNADRAPVVAGQIRYAENLVPTIIGIGAWDESVLLEIAGNNLEGSFFVTEYPSAHGLRKTIADNYMIRFGEKANAFALRAYETVFLLISAIESGAVYRSAVRNWLQSESGITGLDGIAKFDGDGNYLPQATIYKIEGQSYKPWRVIPSPVEVSGIDGSSSEADSGSESVDGVTDGTGVGSASQSRSVNEGL